MIAFLRLGTCEWCTGRWLAAGHLSMASGRRSALESQLGNSTVNLLQLVRGECDVRPADVLLHALDLGRAWNRHDPRLLR